MGDATKYGQGAAAAAAGAALGVVAFVALAKVGLAAHALIGAGAGWGAQWAFRGRSPTMGSITAVIAFVATVGVEWFFFPFAKDQSLLFFLQHFFDLPISTLIMIALSVGIAYWMGQGRGGYA